MRTLHELAGKLAAGYVVIDGGNSSSLHSMHPPREGTSPQGLHYVDVGTSGLYGVLERGYCQMTSAKKRLWRRPRSDLHARAKSWATSRALRAARNPR